MVYIFSHGQEISYEFFSGKRAKTTWLIKLVHADFKLGEFLGFYLL